MSTVRTNFVTCAIALAVGCNGRPATGYGSTISGEYFMHADMRVQPADVIGEGRFILAIRSTKIDGGFHHKVAVYNLSSDRAARAPTVQTQKGGAGKDFGFHWVKYDHEM